MTIEKLEQSIYEVLPQIPYVLDQVGEAIKWAKKELKSGEFNKTLKVAYDVAKFTASISNPNFFKTHLVIASILSNIEDATNKEEFKIFDTTSKSVEKALEALLVPSQKIEEVGCFKATLLQLIPLFKKDEELFAVSLIGIKHDLEEIINGMSKADINEPITAKDYVTILGYALVIANIRMANLKMLDRTYLIYNDIVKLLNGLKY